VSSQRALTDFGAPEPETEDDANGQTVHRASAWTPGDHDERLDHCQSCGAHVTAGFRSTHGDEDGAVYGCPSCYSPAELKRGAAHEGEDGASHVCAGARQ
jgi:hypothetical protein